MKFLYKYTIKKQINDHSIEEYIAQNIHFGDHENSIRIECIF